jgi:hypothetical protein
MVPHAVLFLVQLHVPGCPDAVALHLKGAVHAPVAPHVSVVQPSVTSEPQSSPIGHDVGHLVFTHCPAESHVSGAVHVPQPSVGHPGVTSDPQTTPDGQVVGQHCPVESLHVSGAVHVPQDTVPMHPSGAWPHFMDPQALLFLVQLHVPGCPDEAALHLNGAEQFPVAPQVTVAQPGVTTEPQSSPIGHEVGHFVLTHFPEASHVSGAVHVPQPTSLPHPSGACPH